VQNGENSIADEEE